MANPSGPKGLFVGLSTVDILYTIEQLPRRDEKISVGGQQLSAGGPAANAAVTFAFLGGRADLVTAIGSHPLARVIRDDLRAHSVRLHDLVEADSTPPPVSSIMVERRTGERAVVSANAAVFATVDANFNPRWLRGASVLLVDGHYMPMCIAAARAARQRGIPVVMDSGSWKTGMDRLLPCLDIAICSKTFRPPGCRSTREVFDFLAAQGITRIAITGGPSPIRTLEEGTSASIAVENVCALDTLGAGDIFHGAFCYYASQAEHSFAVAVKKAAHVAGFSCRFPGTRLWMRKFQSPGSKR
jgi:sugar/nucleoside kinase (ribokinase family)